MLRRSIRAHLQPAFATGQGRGQPQPPGTSAKSTHSQRLQRDVEGLASEAPDADQPPEEDGSNQHNLPEKKPAETANAALR